MDTPTNQNPLMPSVPGVGMAGMVMCPYGFQRSPCLKNGCELWVELKCGDQTVGRCSHAWDALLKVDLRVEVEKLRVAIEQSNTQKEVK